MPLSTALYTGVSGLNSNGNGLSVIGNDISNSNTIGFKGGVASFADILSGSLSGGSQIGRGVQMQSVLTDDSQGTLQTTSNPLDMAIQGDGFYILHTAAVGGAQYYTRAGQFSLNKDGNIVDPNGNFLQGYLLGPGQGGVLGTINVSSLNSPPRETGAVSGVSMTANLNSATGVNTTTGLFTDDPTNAQTFTIGNSNNQIEINGATVSLTAGPYTGPGLATELQTHLDTISAPVVVQYNTAVNPYEFTITNGFVVDSTNDTIVFNDGSGSKTATITHGTYASAGGVGGLVAAINTALTTAEAGTFLTASYSGANKFTFTNGALNPNAATITYWSNNGNTTTPITPQEFGFTAASWPTAAIAAGASFAGAAFAANPLTNIDWENANSTAANMLGFSQCDTVNGGKRAVYSVAVGGTTKSDYQVAGFDPTNGSNTSDFSTSLTVYDSLGNNHLINVYFKKIAQDTNVGAGIYATTGNRWMWWAVVPASDSITAQAQIASQGELEFDSGGKLVDDNGGKSAFSTFNFTGGVKQNQSVPFNFGKAIADGGSGLTGTTQFGSPNSVLFQDQDGYSSGSLQSLSVDESGMMSGTFTNGQTENVAQVALARFIASTQLTKQGSNLFSESSTSGGPIIGTAGTSGRGKIFASSLEASNIDLAGEFVNMITVQRGYEANAKVITVTSQLLQTLGQVITA